MKETRPLDEEDRGEVLQRDGLLLGVVLCALLNGMHFSPWYDYALLPIKIMSDQIFGGIPLLTFYFTSILLSTVTLAISGIPAALYERVTGRQSSDARSLAIWLGCCAALSLPAFLRLLGAW